MVDVGGWLLVDFNVACEFWLVPYFVLDFVLSLVYVQLKVCSNRQCACVCVFSLLVAVHVKNMHPIRLRKKNKNRKQLTNRTDVDYYHQSTR